MPVSAASTSRNVWWLTEVDEVAGAYGSAADPVLLCSLRMRSRSLTTVSRVLASSQVAWNTAKDSGGRHCSSAPSGPSVDVQLVALPPDGQVRVDPGLQQALGQAEPAEPAVGHRYPKTGGVPLREIFAKLRDEIRDEQAITVPTRACSGAHDTAPFPLSMPNG